MRKTLLALLALTSSAAFAEDVFTGAKVAEVYRIRLDRGDLLLESILSAIAKEHIEDGVVMSAVGSLSECTYHRVKSIAAKPEDEFLTVKAPIELMNVNGLIAGGEPHLHMTMSSPDRGVFGGHLEKGCKVLYRAEVTIAKFTGTALARRNNKEGVPVLGTK